MKKMQTFRHKIAHFFQSSQKISKVGILLLCSESHISARTYYKIMRSETVKYECYLRLFIGICYAANYEEFMERWNALGESLYWKYSEE